MQAKKKFGISLIVLIITIIVTLIIVSAVVFSIGNNIKEANLSKFTNQISQLEDALNSYYISTNALPQSEEMSKDEVKEVVENYNVFEKELELNGDSSSNLYKLDISQMDIEGDTSKLNNLIYSYPNFNVYDLNGFKQDDNIYYSITSRINDKIVEINNSDSNSSIEVSEGATLKMTNDTSTNTNKLGININATLKPEHILELYFSNITSGKKVKRSDDGYINIVFNNLEQLNESLENTISEDEIDKFNSSTEKIVKAVIKDTNNSNIIAEEICNVSNYDPIAPNFSFVSDAMYDNMKVLRFKVSDNSSGVKEVRYDYLQKFDTNSNVQNYYSSLESFDNQYMEKKAKVLEANDIVDNQIELKIPKEVATVCAIAIDNAGNTSGIETVTYTKNVLCRITIDKTNPTSSNEILYTFKFNKDVQGFEKDDINVTNGIKGTFSKVSSSEYTLLVTDGASGVQIVEVPSDVCTDGNGNQNTGATYKLNIDKISPTISNIIVASPVDGKYKAGQKVDIKVAYDKNIYANSNKSKVTSSNAPKLKIRFGNGSERETSFSSVSEKEIMYSYTIQSGDNGLLTSSSYNGKVYDSLGNELILSSMKIGGYKIEADTTPPTVSITASPSSNPTNASSITYTFKFSEDVKGFESGDIVVTKGTKGTFKTVSAKEYTLVVTNSGSCTQTVTVPAGCCTDLVGNNNTAGTKSVTIDRTPPVLNNIKVTSPSSGTYASGQTVTIVAEYSENVYGSGKTTLTSSTAPVLKIKFGTGTERTTNFSSVSSNKITYTYTISSTDEGVLATTSYSGNVYDAVGNKLALTSKTLTGNNITALTGAINKTTKKYYIKLQDAIDQSSNGNEIQLLSSKAVDKNINIGSNKNIVLDLNNIDISNSTLSTDNEEYIITSSGTTVLKNAKLSGGLLIKNNGNLTISNSQLSTDEYEAIENSSGSLALVDGVNIDCIMATAIRNNSGATLTLGINDGNISTETPKITAKLPILNNGTFNFYDGKLFYENNIAISGIVSTTPTNYDVIYYTENGKKVASLGIAVVKNITKNIGYLDLPTAVNNATDGDIIKMLEDITLSETLDIDKDITLDFNASILSSSITYYVINNTKNLTLTNSASGASGITGKYGIINSGTIDIRVSINADSWHGILNTGTVNLNGGSITGATSGIYSNASSATTNIISGDVESTSGNGVYLKFGTLNIGNNTDGTVSTTSPTISGKNYGVYKEAGTFNFYDGVISGESSAIYGTVNTIPTNYSVIYSNYNKTAKLGKTTDIVATNTNLNKNYDNLQTAIDSANSGNKIKVLKKVELTESIKVAATRNANKNLNTLVIDTNGCEISSSSTYALENSIALTISGTGKIASTGYSVVNNTGTLNLNSTTIEGPSTAYKYGILNTNGTINIAGGTVTSGDGIRLVSGTLTMSSGVINSKADDAIEYVNGKITLTGGKVTGKYGIWKSGTTTAEDVLTLGTDDSTVSTTSPEITTTNGATNFQATGTFNFYDGVITGGSTLSLNVDNLPTKASGTYNVVYSNDNKTAKLSNSAVVENTVSKRKYDDIQVAIDSAASGNKLQLLTKVESNDTISIASGKNVIIDLNNKEIIGNGTTVISNKGTLKISGEGRIFNNYVIVENTSDFTLSGPTLYLNNSTENVVTNSGTFTLESGSLDGISSGETGAYSIGVINYSNVYIQDGIIQNLDEGIHSIGGSVNISENAEVAGKYRYAVYLENMAYLEMTGGLLSGANGVYCNGFCAVSLDNPQTSISDDVYISVTGKGISSSDGDIDLIYYDGVIESTGGDEAIGENIRNMGISTPSGYGVKYSSNYSTASLALATVERTVSNGTIGSGVKYVDINEAIKCSNSGDEVHLLSNLTLTETINVDNGKNVKIEYNGYTITNTTSNLVIKNSGTLTLLDKKTTGGISSSNGISNSGILNVASGDISVSSAYAISNTKTVNVTGGKISGTRGISSTNNSASITMSGGSITAKSGYGIYSYGTTKITSGEVTSTNTYGIYVPTGTLTLGNNNSTIDISDPNITGKSYGVYKYSGTFNFYDGIINGETGAIYGTVNSTPTNYSVIYSNYNKTAILGKTDDIVATNTTLKKNYANIQVAIDSANSGNEIQLKKSFTYSTKISIPSGKTINLDSNGYTITSDSTSSYVISNAGTLNISGTGKLVGTGYSVVNNTGTLNLNSTATIEGPSTRGKYGIVNTDGTINIAGGTVTSGDGIRLDSGTLNMSSGVINSKADDAIEYVKGEITLTGGKITGNYGIYKYGTYSTDVLTLGTDDSTVSTTSPEITTTMTPINFPSTGTFNFYDGVITGGTTLSLNVDNLPTKASGTYNVVYSNENKTAKLSNSAVVENTVSKRKYDDIQVAVDSAASGNELKLLKSISKSTTNQLVEIKSDDDIILNTNGFTLENTNNSSTATSSSSTVYTILNSGTLKITGNGKITGSTYYPIKNDSTLTFETATITGKHAVKNSGDFVMNSGSMKATVTGAIVSNYGNFTIKGGEIKAFCRGIDNRSSESTINIEGGTIEGAMSIIDLDYGTCNMSGGIIQLTEAWNKISGSSCVGIMNTIGNNVTFNMSGGTINNSFKPTQKYDPSDDRSWGSGIYIWNNDTTSNSVNITGGKINVLYGNGIYRYNNGNSEITLGKNDSSVSSTSPTITAGIYGILLEENENASFNFYDGIISGGKKAISADVSDTPSGYKVGYFANGTSAKLIPNSVTAINETTGTTYTSLVTAISNASAGNTVSMQSDTSVSSTISITKALNLNMNKYTLSSGAAIAVLNNSTSGDLTIKSMNHSGKILSRGYTTVYNDGHMVIDGCNVENTATDNYYAIYNSSSSKKLEIENNSNITGGTGVYMYTGILDLNSGTITGNSSYGVYITNNSSSKLNIGDSSIGLSNSTPIITGGTYGIYSAGASSIISLYNGVIKGKTAAINSESYIDNRRSEYDLYRYTSGDDYECLSLTK